MKPDFSGARGGNRFGEPTSTNGRQFGGDQEGLLIQAVYGPFDLIEHLVCEIGVPVFYEAIDQHQNVAKAEDTALPCREVASCFLQCFSQGIHAQQHTDDEVGDWQIPFRRMQAIQERCLEACPICVRTKALLKRHQGDKVVRPQGGGFGIGDDELIDR
jgi:hypothetical protein